VSQSVGQQRFSHEGPSVLLVVDVLFAGGAEQHVMELAEALRDCGWRVELACSVVGCPPDRWQQLGVPVHALCGRLVKRRLGLRFSRRLRKLVRVRNYDVVHAHCYASEAAAAFAVAGTESALVLTEHTEAPWRNRIARRISRIVYARADAIIAVSTSIRRLLVQDYDVDPTRVRFILPIPRRVPTGTRGNERPACLPRGAIVAFIGRLEPEKGVEDLMSAFHKVAAAVPEARLLLVGDGSDRRRLGALAQSLMIDHLTCFLGYRDDVSALLPWVDVLCVPSVSDGSPLVIHEALCAGVPVVGSNVGGIPDRLAGGSAGMLVPVHDVEGFASAITLLLLNTCARQDAVRAGHHEVSRHNHSRMIQQIRAIYHEVCSASDQRVPNSRIKA
jgi:glycosyltransferase involved in cell wall biosynthesis